ncbi:MAG: protein tyrosine phosphatase [Oscillospiraceae bacterium]|nr:protein tyrosine phosphatase [Oscillospiraceae bacterium]
MMKQMPNEANHKLKLLFLCSQNKRRSLTAERTLAHESELDVRSAGTENNARVKVTGGMIGWADIIFTMEKKHTQRIRQRYQTELSGKKVICLYIPDNYEFMDKQLVDIIRSKVNEHINRNYSE